MFIQIIKKFFPLFFFVIALIECSIRIPDVTVSGEMDPFEKQVLGLFLELGNDFQSVSVTAGGKLSNPDKNNSDQEKVKQAIMARKLRKKDVDEVKQAEIVGEQNDGFLKILNPGKVENNSDRYDFIDRLVVEENHNRTILLQRIYSMNKNIDEDQKFQINSIFAKINIQNSKSGTWIQLSEGNWIKKE